MGNNYWLRYLRGQSSFQGFLGAGFRPPGAGLLSYPSLFLARCCFVVWLNPLLVGGFKKQSCLPPCLARNVFLGGGFKGKQSRESRHFGVFDLKSMSCEVVESLPHLSIGRENPQTWAGGILMPGLVSRATVSNP